MLQDADWTERRFQKEYLHGNGITYLCCCSRWLPVAPGGPRYDPAMSSEDRAGEENGLLLCRYCAALVDADETSYPVDLLRLWRRQAYQFALNMLAAPADHTEDTLCWAVVRELVRVCLCTYQTQERVSEGARFRSYAGILYQLFFETLPRETNYDKQMQLWICAIEKITSDVLESAAVRSAHYDGSFPHRYRYLMEELQTYSFDADTCRARVLNTIEAEVRRMFLSEEVFGLKENNAKKIF